MKLATYLSLILSGSLFLTGSSFAASAGQQEGQSLKREIRKTVRSNYLLYLPKDYGKEKSKRWPLILFLHGAGEGGTDLNRVKAHGPPKLVAQGKEMPFIIVSPQSPPDTWWDPEMLNTVLDEVIKRHAVDEDRVYLTGYSMGGYGAWTMASMYSERFAAMAPICGWGEPRRTFPMRNIPTWVFHGAKDEAVPLSESQEMVDALKRLNADVKFTVYPEAGHDSWTETYNNPALYEWFLSHKRPARKN